MTAPWKCPQTLDRAGHRSREEPKNGNKSSMFPFQRGTNKELICEVSSCYSVATFEKGASNHPVSLRNLGHQSSELHR
jgi:hypothetical protein